MTSSTAKNTSKNVAPLDISVIQAFAQLSATVLDLDDLLVASLDILFQTFHYDILAVIFVDDETEELVVKAYKSDLPFNRLDKLPILISETIETGSLIHKEGLFLGKNLAEEQSCLIIPLTIGRLVIGALVTANLHPYEYPPQEKQLLTILASQMTVALTNAQLYKRTRE
ncbi:MAG: GAF domain-containing protein, partial [Aliifodinibius sp.]|nr:GAF domain-containing protein [Fodinibius sp.]NIV16767.1 GAF domain-containing protein [Fodinibius sp.]NIY30769.1 GAF domain-containing protein [Fodinibius sp.]